MCEEDEFEDVYLLGDPLALSVDAHFITESSVIAQRLDPIFQQNFSVIIAILSGYAVNNSALFGKFRRY